MNYLLDTHSFLWTLFSSSKLSKKVTEIILNDENTIYVSVVTFWEISLKYNLEKLKLKKVYPDELPDLAIKSGLEIFNIKEYDVSSFYKLPKLIHRDPFDRLLIWQSIRNNITIISKNKEFKKYNQFGLRTVW